MLIILSDEVNRLAQERIEKLLEECPTESVDEVIAFFEDILKVVWERVAPTLGQKVTMMIIRRALSITSKEHAFMEAVKITPDGISIKELHEDDRGRLYRALKDFVANIIEILAVLTGEILIEQVEKVIENSRSGK